MAKILALDLGVSSIGSAVIDTDKNEILHVVVNIFPAGKQDLGKGEQEVSNNSLRRIYRQMRRQHYRHRMRRQHLLRVLIEQGMCPLTPEALYRWIHWDPSQKSGGRKFPTESAFIEWLSMNPYELRYRALREPLTLYELGRICYAFIQRRGFLSSRKSKEDGAIYKGSKSGEMVGITATQEGMSQHATLGEYLYMVGPHEGEKYCQSAIRMRGRYTLRRMYIEELDTIWERQRHHLGLDLLMVEVKRVRVLPGRITQQRNATKLQVYRQRYDRVEVTEGEGYSTIACYERLPLRDHLMGKVWREVDEMGNNELRFRSNSSLLFWQRPLRSQKGLLDKCSIESRIYHDATTGRRVLSGPRCVPLSHPVFELYRALQEVSQVKMAGRPLSDYPELYRAFFLAMINEKGKVKLAGLKKDFQLAEQFNYEDAHEFSAPCTIAAITALLDKKSQRVSDYRGISLPFDMELYLQIWHKLYTFDDNHQLAANLRCMKGVAFVPNLEEKLAKATLAEGYASLSLHAIHNIIPYLYRGFNRSDSVFLGGIRNAFGERFSYFEKYEDEISKDVIAILRKKNSEGEAVSKIADFLLDPENDFGFSDSKERLIRKLYHPSQDVEPRQIQSRLPKVVPLRNPLVEQALWALRRQVNALVDMMAEREGNPHFVFDAIHVEVTRDLKASKSQRQRIQRRQQENERRNAEIEEILHGFGLHPSRENVHKYKLYQEIEEIKGVVACPYTGRAISMYDLLGEENRIQIEHIIPWSLSMDDSFANKTLCESNFNREKGALTPYQFYQKNSDPALWNASSWEEVERRAMSLLPYEKYRRFIMRKDPSDLQNMASSKLNDTAYISRKAKEYLGSICDSVEVYPGALTAEMRQLWGLDTLLSQDLLVKDSDYPTLSGCENGAEVWALYDPISHEVQQITPVYVTPPSCGTDTLMLKVRVEKGIRFVPAGAPVALPALPISLPDGDYYMTAQFSCPPSYSSFFSAIPDHYNRLVVKVTLRGSKLESDWLTDLSKIDKSLYPKQEGSYWLVLPIEHFSFSSNLEPQKGKSQKGEIRLLGSLKDGRFVHRCTSLDTPLTISKQLAIITPRYSEASFVKIKQPLPAMRDDQLVLEGTLSQGRFSPNIDPRFSLEASTTDAKCYALCTLRPESVHYTPIRNEEPQVSSKELQLVLGRLFRTSSGGMVVRPPKNRADHRHHAVDAIVIGCMNRSIYQRFSTYTASMDAYHRGQSERPRFAPPWEHFRHDAEAAINALFIQHKEGGRVLSKVTKSIIRSGRTYLSQGLSVRGQLHKETVFGKRTAPDGTEGYHHRVSIMQIDKMSKVRKIVDQRIRDMVIEHLRDVCGVDIAQEKASIPKDAFYKDGLYRLYLPNTKGGEAVPIKKVRISEQLSNAQQLKGSNQHVNPRNNHHVLLYFNHSGEVCERVVSFWEAVSRARQGKSVVELPHDCQSVITTLKINDMFIIGLSRNEVLHRLRQAPQSLSAFLYRVQKLSSKVYYFRLHTAATIANESEMLRFGPSFFSPTDSLIHKVSIDSLGHISLCDDKEDGHH